MSKGNTASTGSRRFNFGARMTAAAQPSLSRAVPQRNLATNMQIGAGGGGGGIGGGGGGIGGGQYDPSGLGILQGQQQGMLDLTPEEIELLLMRLLGDGINPPEGYEEEQVCMPNEQGSYNCEEMMIAKPCQNCSSCDCGN